MGSFRLAASNPHLHGYFNFTESLLETVGKSLHLSCRSELTRQGISLPLDPQSQDLRLLEFKIKAKTIIFLLYSTGKVSAPIHLFTNQQRPVFLLNSCYPHFCANLLRFLLKRHPFSRSYGVILPSSFNKVLSTPQFAQPVHLCRIKVRFLFLLFLGKFNKHLYTININFNFRHLFKKDIEITH